MNKVLYYLIDTNFLMVQNNCFINQQILPSRSNDRWSEIKRINPVTSRICIRPKRLWWFISNQDGAFDPLCEYWLVEGMRIYKTVK
jgi:hypothetical protein